MKKFTRVLAVLIATVMVLIAMCISAEAVTSPQLTKTSVTLYVGGTHQLYVNYVTKSISWSSSNNAVATVKDGKVTAKAAGTATVTVKHGNTSLKCKVTVKEKKSTVNTSDSVSSTTYNGHTYAVYDIGGTWDEAKAYCEKLGGHLVTITSAEEQQAVERIVKLGSKNNYWLGGNLKNRTLSWITGESVTYTNWSSSQPDNYQNDDCAEILRIDMPGLTALKWGDVNRSGVVKGTSVDSKFGTSNFGFVCEWESNTGINKVDKSGSVSSATYNGHTYAVYDIGGTWDEAKAYCEKLGGHLVTITSAEEEKAVEKIVKLGSKNNYWLGGNLKNKTLSWITGEAVTYTNWSGSQPDNYQNDDCAEILRIDMLGLTALKWGDVNRSGVVKGTSVDSKFGTSNFGFICEWDTAG